MGQRKMERETGAGEKKRERETGMGERKIERQERERAIGRETGVGEREEKLQTQKNSWNFILSYFTPQNGVKNDIGL